ESTARTDFAELEAIVETVTPHLMSEGVELGADLAKFGDNQLFVGHASIRYRQRGFRIDVEDAVSVDERFLRIRRKYRGEFEYLTGLDQFCRAQNRLRFHHIPCTALIVDSPLRWTALIVGGHLPSLSVKRRTTERQ